MAKFEEIFEEIKKSYDEKTALRVKDHYTEKEIEDFENSEEGSEEYVDFLKSVKEFLFEELEVFETYMSWLDKLYDEDEYSPCDE